jgi:hypothetical protein
MVNSILNPPTLSGAAIVHGQVHEASALKKFAEVTGKQVQDTGEFYYGLIKPYTGGNAP